MVAGVVTVRITAVDIFTDRFATEQHRQKHKDYTYAFHEIILSHHIYSLKLFIFTFHTGKIYPWLPVCWLSLSSKYRVTFYFCYTELVSVSCFVKINTTVFKYSIIFLLLSKNKRDCKKKKKNCQFYDYISSVIPHFRAYL